MFSQNHSERQCSWSCSVHTHTLISEHREQLHFLVPFALSHHTSRRPALSTTLFGFVSKTHNFWRLSKVLTYYKRLWEVSFYNLHEHRVLRTGVCWSPGRGVGVKGVRRSWKGLSKSPSEDAGGVVSTFRAVTRRSGCSSTWTDFSFNIDKEQPCSFYYF